MKQSIFKFSLLVWLLTIFVPSFIIAQQQEEYVSLQSNGGLACDSIHTSYWSKMFDVESLDQMHKELDSIFSTLDGSLSKRIKVMAFDMDSLARYFDFNFDFNRDLDSLMSIQELRNNDHFTDLDTLLKYHYGIHHLNKIIEDDHFSNFEPSRYPGMDVEVTTDTITNEGNTIITKRVVIVSNDSLQMNHSKKYKEKGEDSTSYTYTYKEGFSHPNKHMKMEKAKSKIKSGEIEGSKKNISNIDISDSELLVKAGVSSKIITSPALKPDKVSMNVKVENKNGKEVKNIDLSIYFKDTAPIQVMVLDKDGNTIFEEKQKSFTGTYTHHMELNEALVPYYFLMIRDKKLFGRMLQN